jgi:hypothetical protein
MAVDYIPLATSPSSEEDGELYKAHSRSVQAALEASRSTADTPRRRPPTLSALGIFTRQFTKTRILILAPLLILPILFHITFTSLWSPPPSSSLGNNPYFQTGDVWAHNDEVVSRIARCRELDLLRNTSAPLAELPQEREADLIAEGCGTNQTTVVILASLYFAEAYAGVNTAGEVIYAQSVISTLNAYDYAYVFSSLGWYNHDMRKTVELWRQLKGNVRTVMADPEQVDLCWGDKGQECLKTAENPGGIEAWRLMTFWYWDE